MQLLLMYKLLSHASTRSIEIPVTELFLLVVNQVLLSPVSLVAQTTRVGT